MGQVPQLRVAKGYPAFSNTALDMFGPVHIRLNRKTLKEAHVILFSCMTTRVVHLELVSDKSSDTFLMAFRRFASIRDIQAHVGRIVALTLWVEEVSKTWKLESLQSRFAQEFSCDLKWNWNIPTASHQNGILIKSVRKALDATCKNQAFTEEQWRTFLAEITFVINGRPLYPSSDCIWEEPPITPNDINLGSHNIPPQPLSE